VIFDAKKWEYNTGELMSKHIIDVNVNGMEISGMFILLFTHKQN
jgi:hypothetical protein